MRATRQPTGGVGTASTFTALPGFTRAEIVAEYATRSGRSVEAVEFYHIAALAGELDLDPLACAEGIIRVANAEMVRALRVVTIQRGVDPREYALLAFGGAGPLHAAAIADELGITTILCPRASGVLAALGLVVSPRRRDVQQSVFLTGDALSAEAIARITAELGDQARAALGGAGSAAALGATYELRYRGQAFELPIRAELDARPAHCGRRSRPSTGTATATATPSRSSSWSPCG